jgi:hypothetical protein
MMDSQTAQTMFPIGVIKTGATLMGGGLLIAAVGMTMTAVAVMRRTAAWARQREVSPTALAADQLGRVRHATLAGAHAWHEYADSANGHMHGHHARTQ